MNWGSTLYLGSFLIVCSKFPHCSLFSLVVSFMGFLWKITGVLLYLHYSLRSQFKQASLDRVSCSVLRAQESPLPQQVMCVMVQRALKNIPNYSQIGPKMCATFLSIFTPLRASHTTGHVCHGPKGLSSKFQPNRTKNVRFAHIFVDFYTLESNFRALRARKSNQK